jgi:hypothetical protein
MTAVLSKHDHRQRFLFTRVHEAIRKCLRVIGRIWLESVVLAGGHGDALHLRVGWIVRERVRNWDVVIAVGWEAPSRPQMLLYHHALRTNTE